MAEIKMTKNELREQQLRLHQLQKYLPTLQLKKALLQTEVTTTRLEVYELKDTSLKKETLISEFSSLLTQTAAIDVPSYARPLKIDTHIENIAGIDIPIFDGCAFKELSYNLFDTPIWVESAIAHLQEFTKIYCKITVAKKRLELLEKELREVTIRVNLFEKILIPRALKNIKKIKVFLGDMQLAAVGQAKVAKAKITEQKLLHEAHFELGAI